MEASSDRRIRSDMAETKLEVEKRLDKVEERLDRVEMAVSVMSTWLVQAQTGFSAKDAEGIEKILRGENSQKTE